MEKYRVLSLFSGMGGMDIGFADKVVVHSKSVEERFVDTSDQTPYPEGFVKLKALPFKIVFQNDILPIAQKIAVWNGWAHNYILKDIRELLKEDYNLPHADVVIGGFPCQDFSHAGKRKGFDTSRGTLYQSFVDVIRRVKPIIFVAENVHGLLTMPNKPINKIIEDFASVGYHVGYQLIKCEEYGIPQTRWRVIIMGIRLDKRHYVGDNWNIINCNTRQCHVRPYFSHLGEPHETDDVAQQVYSKASKLEKGQGQKEIILDDYGPTMRAEHHGNIEFRRTTNGKNNENHLEERRLTVREAALLQTFPPNCILTDPAKPRGTLTAYKPIGNAVPPLLGYLIANHVANILSTLSE